MPVIFERVFRAHVLAEHWTLQLSPSRPAATDLGTKVNISQGVFMLFLRGLS
jgi:hypothetical protein